MHFISHIKYSARWAMLHGCISLVVALMSAVLVFWVWYPSPYLSILQVGEIYGLLLVVDVVCGPLLTMILVNPKKSRKERWLDLSLVGLLQIIALLYGMHSVWQARPVAVAFEVDRLVLVTANEIQTEALHLAPENMKKLPWAGVFQVATRQALSSEERLETTLVGLAGISPGMRPDWWLPWDVARPAIQAQAKPLYSLAQRRLEDLEVLQSAAKKSGLDLRELFYLPFVSSKTNDWIALLDSNGNVVGYAHVDGF